MGQGNNNPPAEHKPDNYLRCPRCRGILIEIIINIRYDGAPYDPIAKVIKCGNSYCGHIHKRFLLPGVSISGHHTENMVYTPSTAEKYGINKWMVKKCLDIAPKVTAFTVTEFKEGKVHGFEKYTTAQYNPNKFTEPAEEKIF